MSYIVLVDLPVFPKGTLSLSLPYLASVLGVEHTVSIIDLNISSLQTFQSDYTALKPVMMGLKVSAQNFSLACETSKWIKDNIPTAKVVWGGEFPSLLPNDCFPHADSIVSGLFDNIAQQFLSDLKSNSLQKIYTGGNEHLPGRFTYPDWNLIEYRERYNHFMGIPLETSRGCSEVCTFCMVHVMQKKHYHTKPADVLAKEIAAIGSNFINIVDYNFGVSKQHIIDTCAVIEKSEAVGFMAEMCLENLDDDNVLRALSNARCKMIYCGLETIQEDALKSVHKMNTNHIENYRRIIGRAHHFGIQVASGFILAMEGTTEHTFKNTLAFFEETGIMYAKLTFLTYNPGTKVQQYYRKKGTFISEQAEYYDGNHLSYLPDGVDEQTVYKGTTWFIKNFYSLGAIIRRSKKIQGGLLTRLGFICFNVCYAVPYKKWLANDIFTSNAGFNRLLQQPHSKSIATKLAEWLLLKTWRAEYNLRRKTA